MRKRLFATLALLGALSLAAEARKVSVEDFGAKADDGINDAEALRSAAAYCRAHKGTTLVFPAGVYDFSDPVAAKIEREAIDGTYGCGLQVQRHLFHPQKPYVVGLDFTGARNLTIEATGATLMIEGWMEPLSFVRCTNLTVKGLAVDYKRPATTEAKLTEIGPDYVIAEFDPELYKYSDKLVQGRTHFYSTSEARIYDLDCTGMELVAPGKILYKVVSSKKAEIGDVLVIRIGGHYRPCFMLRECKNVTLKDVTIFSFPGMGIVGHQSEDILIDHLQVIPAAGRCASTVTDATHFTSCSGNLTIQNCLFRGNGDDCTNVHNYYWYPYADSTDSRKVELRVENADLHAQSLDYPHKGDTIRFVGRRNLVEQGRYIVRKVDTSWVDWKVVVTLDKPVSKEMCDSCFSASWNRFPYVKILNNTVNCHLARSFLIKAPYSYIAGNKIFCSAGTALKLGGELSWHESGPVRGCIIENNYISRCFAFKNESLPENGPSILMISTEAPETPPYVNGNVIIRNNVFEANGCFPMEFFDTENVQIYGNRCDEPLTVKQHHCRNIVIK